MINADRMHRMQLTLTIALFQLATCAQNLNVFLLQLHGAGCDDQSGVLVAHGTGGVDGYTYLWNDGSTNDTITDLGAGLHTVTVYSGGDSAVTSFNMPPFGIDAVNIHHVCGGDPGVEGFVYLNDIAAQYPIQFAWYDGDGNLLPETSPLLSTVEPDTYHYAVTDAEGCIDSGTVVLHYSDPVLEVFVSDTALCYGQTALMWYTPGFTLYDNWGLVYNSSTDTIHYVNQMGGVNSYPTIGVDSLGCEAALADNPFIYQQPHPDPIQLYHYTDTISTTWGINYLPSTSYTYVWYLNGELIDTSAYSYLPIDTSGFYAVSVINQYGCSVFGTIQGNVSNAVPEGTAHALWSVGPNPVVSGEAWMVDVPACMGTIPFRLADATGRLVANGRFRHGRNALGVDLPAGAYLLEAAGRSVRLVRTR